MNTRSSLVVLGLASLASTAGAFATIGLAEWTVYTPGGHLISHTDGYKEEHGDCLRSVSSRGGSSNVLVSHLKRWRYFEGYVVGETGRQYFLLDERTEQVRLFPSDAAAQRALRGLGLGPALSPWLTAADGWREAWFPHLVWKPCRSILRGDPAPTYPPGLSRHECSKALSPDTLDLYRRTTWGRQCRRLGERHASASDPVIDEFCESLGF